MTTIYLLGAVIVGTAFGFAVRWADPEETRENL